MCRYCLWPAPTVLRSLPGLHLVPILLLVLALFCFALQPPELLLCLLPVQFLLRFPPSFRRLLALAFLWRKPSLMQGFEDVRTEIRYLFGDIRRRRVAMSVFLPVHILPGADDLQQVVLAPPLFALKGWHANVEYGKYQVIPSKC